MPIGPPPCLTGRGRASPFRRLCRARPVLVSRAVIVAQARPGACYGPGTSPHAPGPDRVSAVLSWAGPVPAQRARPSWPAILKGINVVHAHSVLDFFQLCAQESNKVCLLYIQSFR